MECSITFHRTKTWPKTLER